MGAREMPGLELDIDSLVRPGRKPAAAEAYFVRELSVDDLPLLATHRGTEPTELKKLSERHHTLARSMALGMSVAEAAANVGMTVSRVSILKGSPAFQELMELYRENADREFQNTAARLSGLAHDAVVEIARRLEDEGEEIPMGQLIEVAKMAADRTGLGPSATQKVEINDMGSRIEAARQRALAARAPKLIEDAEIVDITPHD